MKRFIVFVSFLIAVVFLTATSSVVFAQDPCGPGYHQVVSGETLTTIAIDFGTSWPHLAEINHISDPDNIQVGMCILLPGASSTAVAYKITATPEATLIPEKLVCLSYGTEVFIDDPWPFAGHWEKGPCSQWGAEDDVMEPRQERESCHWWQFWKDCK